MADGSLPIDDLELPGADLPEHDAADTVAGYVVATLGRLASPGDVIEIGGYEATVEDVRARRVHRVRFRRIAPPPPAEEDGA
ncbi:Transporter associated domain protein [compost metagenome]